MIPILVFSVLLQLWASLLALRLAWITGRQVAWTLITTAVLLMAIRRALVLVGILSGRPVYPDEPVNELIGLAISALLLAGIGWIAPVLLTYQRAQQQQLETQESLERRIRERTAELSEISQALQAQLEERAWMEAALREEHDFIAAVLDTTSALVLVLDAEGRIVRVNRAITDLTGYTPEALQGRDAGEALFSEGDVDLLHATFRRFIETGESVNGFEYPWVSSGGQVRQIAWSATALRGADGAVRYAIIAGIDITARKQAEQALQTAYDQLETRVAERTAELKATNEQLQQEIAEHERADAERENLIRELDAFAHTVAHDLKNPINLIVGFADALLQDFPTLPETEIRDYLHTIAWSGRKMSNIINELLLLAGIRGREEVEIVPLDMDHVINEVLQRLAYMTRDVHSEIVRPRCWPSALGYPPWVEEVWANYISNGLKYGGQPPRLELGADILPDGMVRFWVRDNGPGIPPEDQGRLFTPFTQLDQVRAKGHGLGLSIVQRIVERLGGQVGVESVVGQGSVFSFTLPAAEKNNTGQIIP